MQELTIWKLGYCTSFVREVDGWRYDDYLDRTDDEACTGEAISYGVGTSESRRTSEQGYFDPSISVAT
jgi:hypothetical protein